MNFYESWGGAKKTNGVYSKIYEKTVFAQEFLGDNQYFGLEMHSGSIPSLLISSGHKLRLGGGTILVWGAQAVIWGARPGNASPWRWACSMFVELKIFVRFTYLYSTCTCHVGQTEMHKSLLSRRKVKTRDARTCVFVFLKMIHYRLIGYYLLLE